MTDLRTAYAFFKRDLRIDVSLKLTFLLTGVDAFVMVLVFYYLGRATDTQRPDSVGTFPPMLVGLAVSGYMTTALICLAQSIKGRQQGGALTAVLASPITPLQFVCFSSAYPMLRAGIDGMVYLIGGRLLGVSLPLTNAPTMIVIFIVSVLAFSSLGIVSAAFTIAFKRGDPLMWLIGSTSWLLSGVFYPIDVLPRAMQHIAWLLPTAHALHATRAAALRGATLSDVLPDVGAMLLFASVMIPVSAVLFRLSLRYARVHGTLSHV